eukprot:SAG25_NODE_28_length_20925_cov_13.342839_14_plen_102_part_00
MDVASVAHDRIKGICGRNCLRLCSTRFDPHQPCRWTVAWELQQSAESGRSDWPIFRFLLDGHTRTCQSAPGLVEVDFRPIGGPILYCTENPVLYVVRVPRF